jgi:diguanylate cyclase (GGDEF)-like protein/PAS domain S-box-containing protein
MTEFRSLREPGTLLEFVGKLREGIYLTNAGGEILDANPAFLAMFGVASLEEIARYGAHELFVDPSVRERELALLTSEGAVREFEFDLRRPDGEVRTVLDTCTVVRSPGSGELRFLGVLVDITDRKRAERARAESETSFRKLIEQSADAIYVIQDDRLVLVNTAWERMFGYSAAEATSPGFTFWRVIAPSSVSLVEERVRRREAGQPVEPRYELQGITKDGRVIDLETSIADIEWQGRPAVQGIYRDVSGRKRASEALGRTLSLLTATLESTADGILVVDRDGRIVSFNRKFAELWRLPPQLYGTRDRALLLEHACRQVVEPERFLARLRELDASPELVSMDVIEFTDGRVFERYSQPQRVGNVVAGRVSSFRDVTQRTRAERELRTSHRLINAVIDGTADPIFVKDLEGRYLMVNQAFVDFAKRSREVIVGRFDVELFDPEEAARYGETDARVLATGLPLVFESSGIVAGEKRIHLVTKSVFRDEAGRIAGVVGVARDITERKQAEEQLLHDAFHDALTGLPNRALFTEELRLALDRGKRRRDYRFAVLFLDLDQFKVVNDSLGHLVGDRLLVAMAQRLQKCLRPGDRVARLGGDEFTILLDEIGDVDAAERIAERIQAELAEPFDLDGHEVFTSASIGIALSTAGYDQPEQMLRDADLAMYRAKALGRNRVEQFDHGMRADAVARLRLETDLRHALERGEFRLLYQPIVSQASGRTVGFEALLRWQHPTRGLLLPDEFLRVSEENNLMVPMGGWVLEQACRQLGTWLAAYPDREKLGVSVNLSTKQLLQPELAGEIRRVLKQTGVPAHKLKLEVTEDVVMERAEAAAAVLEQLKAMDVRVYLDDFGTGYSSLSYLRRFPLDALKIDRFFVSRMEDPENLEIVRAIITLARNLRLRVIAEGVETPAQAAQLRALECEYLQGHLFAGPLTPEAAGELLERETQRQVAAG